MFICYCKVRKLSAYYSNVGFRPTTYRDGSLWNGLIVTYANDIVPKQTPTETDLTYTIPSTHVFDGNPQGFTVTPHSGVGAVTVLYNGSSAAPTNAGTYAVTVDVAEGTDYAAVNGLSLGSYMIAPLSLSDITITADFGTLTYNGSAQTPSPSNVTFDGTSVVPSTDYTLSIWANNTNAGTASVTLAGAGNYTGSQVVNFTIDPKPLTLITDDKTIFVGDTEPIYTYTVDGLIAPDTAAVIDTAPSMSVTGFKSTNPASYPIVIAGGITSNANYTVGAHVNGTLTVTASVVTGGGGSGSGNGGGGGGGVVATTIPADDGTVAVTYTISGGVATLTLPDSKLTEIIGKAKDDKATLDLSKVANATGATMPKSALTQLSGAGLTVEVKLPQGTVAFSATAAASNATQVNSTNVTVSLNQVNQSTLTAVQRAAINPSDLVFNTTVTSGTQVITNFNSTIAVTVPYTGDLPVTVWYLDTAGELEELSSVYDPVIKTVTFTTNYLSLYVVGLNNEPTPITPTMPVNPFSDVFGTDWFIDDVIYAHNKGLIEGTTPTTFSPSSNLKYSEAITLAARMHQLYTSGEVTLENDDDLWYQSYVDYAIDNGIINADYDWNATATRAGYMQIFANALPDDAFTAINNVPDGSIPDVPMDYLGAASIYKLYRAGILQGNDSAYSCIPGANIRRSEVAAIFTRMMNLDARINFSIK